MTDSFQSRRPGPSKPLTAKRELYLRLMRQGLSNSEVCRQVGGQGLTEFGTQRISGQSRRWIIALVSKNDTGARELTGARTDRRAPRAALSAFQSCP